MIGMMNNGTADVPNEFFGGKRGSTSKKEFRIYSEKRMLKDKISYGKDGRMLVDGRLAAASEVLEPGQLWDELMMRMMCRAVCDTCIKEPAPPKRRFSDYLPWRRRTKSGSAAANAIANAATAVSELQARKYSESKSPNNSTKTAFIQNNRHKTSTGSENSKSSENKNTKTENTTAKEPKAFVNAFATRFGKKKNNDSSSTGSSENSSQQCSSATATGKPKSYGAKPYEQSSDTSKPYSPNNSHQIQLRNGWNSTPKSNGNIENISSNPTKPTAIDRAKRPISTATEEMISSLASKISSRVSRSGSNTMTNMSRRGSNAIANTNAVVKEDRIVRSSSSSSLKAFNVISTTNTNAVLRNSEQPRARRPLSISTLTSLATKSSPRSAYKPDNMAPPPGPRRPLHATTTTSNSISTRFFGNGGSRISTPTTNQTSMEQRFSKVR